MNANEFSLSAGDEIIVPTSTSRYAFNVCIELLAVFLASTVCWMPSIGLHWLRGNAFSFIDVVALSTVIPLVAAALTYCLQSLVSTYIVGRSVPIVMLAALWMFGPAAMLLSATATGSGFANDNAWNTLAFLTVIFPLATPSLSVYDGSCVGLLVTSVMLLVIFILGLTRPVSETGTGKGDGSN